MNFENIHILACKFGKKVKMDYYNKLDSLNYSVEDGDLPHPDLSGAMKAFQGELAESHYVLGDEKNNFVPTGFSVEEKKDKFFVKVSGKMTTDQDDKVAVNSGNLDMEPLEDKVDILRQELFAFFFEGKNAQAKIDFPKEEPADATG